MTPAEFMDEIVIPTLRELRDERRSRRRAYLACIAVFHVKDHLKKAGEQGVEDTMRASCGVAFDVARGVGKRLAQTTAERKRNVERGRSRA